MEKFNKAVSDRPIDAEIVDKTSSDRGNQVISVLHNVILTTLRITLCVCIGLCRVIDSGASAAARWLDGRK